MSQELAGATGRVASSQIGWAGGWAGRWVDGRAEDRREGSTLDRPIIQGDDSGEYNGDGGYCCCLSRFALTIALTDTPLSAVWTRKSRAREKRLKRQQSDYRRVERQLSKNSAPKLFQSMDLKHEGNTNGRLDMHIYTCLVHMCYSTCLQRCLPTYS